jgi:transcriptional regulator with XRE-family HTH domain
MPVAKAIPGANQERIDFSNRLRDALKRANYAPDSPTQLAREFNARNQHRPVTIHAARKWLVGESIPTQEKLRLLSEWLGVSTEWLRFGESQQSTKGGKKSLQQQRELNRTELAIMQNLLYLDEEQQEILLKLVLNFVKAKNPAQFARTSKKSAK